MAGEIHSVNYGALDSLVIDYAEAEELIKGNLANCGSQDNHGKQLREFIDSVRWLICSGKITDALAVLQGSGAQVAKDQRLLFRLHKQAFIEALRAGQQKQALSMARTLLEPTSLHAYPEAYSEFKTAMLALLYSPGDRPSPVAKEWEEERRVELAAVVATSMRTALKVDDPPLPLVLRYLISLQDRLCSQHGWASPCHDLTSQLISKSQDPAPVPMEQIYEAPAYPEGVVQCLAHAVGITRQEAVDSLRCAQGDLHRAFKNELGRVQVDRTLLDELVYEYCGYRGLVALSGPWPASWQLCPEPPGPGSTGTAANWTEAAPHGPHNRQNGQGRKPEPMGVCSMGAGTACSMGAGTAAALAGTGAKGGGLLSQPDAAGRCRDGEGGGSKREQEGSVGARADGREGVPGQSVAGPEGWKGGDVRGSSTAGSQEDMEGDRKRSAGSTRNRNSEGNPAPDGEGPSGEGCERSCGGRTSSNERANGSCHLNAERGAGMASARRGESARLQSQPHRLWKGRPPGSSRHHEAAPPSSAQYGSGSTGVEGASDRLEEKPDDGHLLHSAQPVMASQERWQAQSRHGQVLAVQELVRAGRREAALAAVDQLAPAFARHHPQLLFELHQTEFLRVLHSGEWAQALAIARSDLGPLAAAHPHLLPHLKAALLTLARPEKPSIGGARSAADLATAFQVALASSLGLREPRLVRLLSSLLGAHSSWFREQLCSDEFAALLHIGALKEPSVGPLLAGSLIQEGADSSSGTKDHGTVKNSEPKSISHGINETAVLQLMEFMAVSRSDAIQLLGQYDGDVEIVLASLLGY